MLPSRSQSSLLHIPQSSQAAQESAVSRAALLRSDAQLQASESSLRAAEEQLQTLRREMEESRGQVRRKGSGFGVEGWGQDLDSGDVKAWDVM